ncbi:MAG: hypothetical protein C4519_11700 [Desulfobacteraceae bacterium]|nr:MAG: hypothetical protein C4519_11700 [Desulfobacteraceae bacterium]
MLVKDDAIDMKHPQFARDLDPNTYQYSDEDEINLIEYLATLFKYKWMIVLIVFFSAVAAMVVSLLMSNVYRSEATISLRESEKNVASLGALGGLGGLVASQLGIGGGGSLEKLEVVLKSRDLASRVINQYELMPILFAHDWDAEKKRWLIDEPPTLQDGMKKIRELLSISADLKKSTILVGFEDEKPETARKIVNHFLIELSSSLREEVMRDATENMRFFKEQLEKTSDPLLREKIYALLAKEIEKETFAKAQKYYGFLVLDPPIAPDLDKKIKPKRALICILSVFVAFFASVFLAFLIEFCKKVKNDDPEHYRQIADGLKIWRLPFITKGASEAGESK